MNTLLELILQEQIKEKEENLILLKNQIPDHRLDFFSSFGIEPDSVYVYEDQFIVCKSGDIEIRRTQSSQPHGYAYWRTVHTCPECKQKILQAWDVTDAKHLETKIPEWMKHDHTESSISRDLRNYLRDFLGINEGGES